MNVDAIFAAFERHRAEFILIGGVNFLLRHEPILTFDVDLWIRDTPENRAHCVNALSALHATWGESESTWGPIDRLPDDWLARRSVHCLLSDEGPIDIFRSVTGLPAWEICAARAHRGQTATGTPYRGLSDADMLACQMALDEPLRKLDRVRRLRDHLQRDGSHE